MNTSMRSISRHRAAAHPSTWTWSNPRGRSASERTRAFCRRSKRPDWNHRICVEAERAANARPQSSAATEKSSITIDPAVSAGFDASYGIVYAGLWASSVDEDFVGGNLEIDYYAGIKPTLGAATFDFGVLYYTYPGASDPASGESEVFELKAAVSGEIDHADFERHRRALPSRRWASSS